MDENKNCNMSNLTNILPEENEDIFLYNDSKDTIYDSECEKSTSPKMVSKKYNLKSINFSNFFFDQIFTSFDDINYDDSDYLKKCQKVTSIFKIPMQLEIFINYGFLQCTNSFFQLFIFLPIRFFLANMYLFYRILDKTNYIWLKLTNLFFFFPFSFKRSLSSSEICDLIKGYLLCTTTIIFLFIDSSMIYHLVRGQSIVKLYIFFNMLEVADRLCNSLGQDILESYSWAAKNHTVKLGDSHRSVPTRLGLFYSTNRLGHIVHFLLSLIYLLIHSFVILLQATALNVAFNSHNKALLTIMISNNFVELKGNVFKKFEKGNLFQMSCSDVRERFSYVIALSVVLLRNMTEFSWSSEHFFQIFPDMILVLVAEVFIDWIKHAFITKFNEIPVEVYSEYATCLAKDALFFNPPPNNANSLIGDFEVVKDMPKKFGRFSRCGHVNNNNLTQTGIFCDNNSDLVCKQTGFTPLPHAVVLAKTLLQTCKATDFHFLTPQQYHVILPNLPFIVNAAITMIDIPNIVIALLVLINMFLIKLIVNLAIWYLGIKICVCNQKYSSTRST